MLHQAPDFSTASLSDTKRRVALPSPCWLKARTLISYTKEGSAKRGVKRSEYSKKKKISKAKLCYGIVFIAIICINILIYALIIY